MKKEPVKIILLILILVFSIVYRFLLMTWNVFPSGSDIGLHESTINSILAGRTGLFWNYYHMGGGLSATNPGYHIFVISIMAFTGITGYLAQILVTAFFSAMIPLCTFLIVRRMWNESAAFIAAFLTIFSAGDIGILSWGGYPNIIALMLIPVIFYLFLQRSKFRLRVYLLVVSLLIGAMFLTHVFSAMVFATIVGCALLVNVLFSKRIGFSRSQIISWFTPIIFGAIIVLPYLVGIAPAYFGSQGAITGTVLEMKQAVLETRIVPIEVIPLSFIPVSLLFMLSKIYKGKYLTVSTVLLSVWILVPAIMTQSWLLGIYLDYLRFIYFLYLPVIICVALMIVNAPDLISRGINRVSSRLREKIGERKKLNAQNIASILPRKLVYSVIVLGLLVFSVFVIPIFKSPNAGIAEVNSYQVMTPQGFEAIQWIRSNTAPGSVCVADGNYGWWLSGFTQRPTLSAVDPQYLILTREFEPAKAATNLLTANYVIDNSLVRFQDDGPYRNDKHELFARFNDSYILYPFFGVNDTEKSLVFSDNGNLQQLSFEKIPVVNSQVVNGSGNASYILERENELFRYTEEIIIYQGMSFAEISITLQSKTQSISFEWLHYPFQSRGRPIQYTNSICLNDSNMGTLNQLIFPAGQLGNGVLMQENPDFLEIVYNLKGNSMIHTNFFVGSNQFLDQSQAQASNENNQTNYTFEYLQSLVLSNSISYLGRTSDLPIDFFDYQKAINDWNISYIAVRDAEAISRFSSNALFNLVFENREVCIFKVENTQK